MNTKVFIDNWNKSGMTDYRIEYKFQHIPRIGERITFNDEDEEGNWENKYYVVDIVHQIKNDTHNIYIIISDDLDNVSNFYYNNNDMLSEIHYEITAKK